MQAKSLKMQQQKITEESWKTGFCDLWDFESSTTLILAPIEKLTTKCQHRRQTRPLPVAEFIDPLRELKPTLKWG